MPPSPTTGQLPPRFQSQDTTHMLPRPSITTDGRLPLQVEAGKEQHERSSIGPMVGALIIITLLIFGGLYFWGARLDQEAAQKALPFIPASE